MMHINFGPGNPWVAPRMEEAIVVNQAHFGTADSSIYSDNIRGMLETSLKVDTNDRVLIITDPGMLHLGNVFLKESRQLGAQSEIYILPENLRPLTAVPDLLKTWLEIGRFTAAVNIFEDLRPQGEKPGETAFRVALTELEENLGLKVGHSPARPGIIERIMSTKVNYPVLMRTAENIINRLQGASQVRITTPASRQTPGTDLSFEVEGRPFTTDMTINQYMRLVNLPPGEVLCAALEYSASGRLVVPTDGLVSCLGAPNAPVIFSFAKGKIVEIESRDLELVTKFKEMLIDDWAHHIGEFGIGLRDDFKKFFGHMLPDEKRGGTIHVAVGNNLDMPGGENASETHHDLLIPRPTVWITFRCGITLPLISNGKLTENLR